MLKIIKLIFINLCNTNIFPSTDHIVLSAQGAQIQKVPMTGTDVPAIGVDTAKPLRYNAGILTHRKDDLRDISAYEYPDHRFILS